MNLKNPRGSKNVTLTWLGVVGWLAFAGSPIVIQLIYAFFRATGIWLPTSAIWASGIILATGVSVETFGLVVFLTFLATLSIAGAGILFLTRNKEKPVAILLIIGGLTALIFYPGVVVGPAILIAVGLTALRKWRDPGGFPR